MLPMAIAYEQFVKTRKGQKHPSPGGLEPPTFRLTVERADQLRHGDMCKQLHVIAYQ